MKRLIIIILSIIISSVVAFADASFDKTINYQFNNAEAYIGEILYLMPITGSYYDSQHYQRFKNFDADENEITYNALTNQYKFDPFDYRDCKYAGTHKRHIEGHKFRVDNVLRYLDYKFQWVFYLTDLNTGDKLKFDYYGEPELYMNSFIDFPFITMKFFNYYKSLIGTNLVFSTKKSIEINELASVYAPDFKDINTGEIVQFSGAYAKWKIKDVIIDKYDLCLMFIVTNGKNTIKIPYDVPYSTKTKQPYYLISKYPAGVRVFPESQWNEMINKYGEEHMTLIMNSKVSDDMTEEERYLAIGKKFEDKSNEIKVFEGILNALF